MLSPQAQIGLAVTSHVTTTLSTAVFDSFTAVGGTTPSATQVAQAQDQILAGLVRSSGANPAFVIRDTAYDAEGQVTATTDGRGIVTSYDYDSQGRQVSVTEATGTTIAATTQYRYDAQGHRIRMIDPVGTITAMTYSGRNLMTSTVEAANIPTIAATTTYSHTETGRVFQTTDPLNRTTTNHWGTCCEDRLASVEDPLGFRPSSPTTPTAAAPRLRIPTTSSQLRFTMSDIVRCR